MIPKGGYRLIIGSRGRAVGQHWQDGQRATTCCPGLAWSRFQTQESIGDVNLVIRKMWQYQKMSNPPPCLFLESLNRSRSFYTSEEYGSWVWGPGSLIFGFHLVGKLTRVYEAPWHAFVTTTCSQLYKYLQQFSSKLLQQNQFDVLLPGCFRMGTAQLQNLVSRLAVTM